MRRQVQLQVRDREAVAGRIEAAAGRAQAGDAAGEAVRTALQPARISEYIYSRAVWCYRREFAPYASIYTRT